MVGPCGSVLTAPEIDVGPVGNGPTVGAGNGEEMEMPDKAIFSPEKKKFR